MEYTNARKLSAVVARWLFPMSEQLVGMKLSSLPFLTNLEAKIKATGWVGNGYSIMSDLSPIMRPIVDAMLAPAVCALVQGVPDDVIPVAAHKIVCAAIENNGLTLLDGKVSFTRQDMERLKCLLEKNLPIGEQYEVIE